MHCVPECLWRRVAAAMALFLEVPLVRRESVKLFSEGKILKFSESHCIQLL